jgi:hypothetical protein
LCFPHKTEYKPVTTKMEPIALHSQVQKTIYHVRLQSWKRDGQKNDVFILRVYFDNHLVVGQLLFVHSSIFPIFYHISNCVYYKYAWYQPIVHFELSK